MGSSSQSPPPQIECWGKFNFTEIDDANYVATLNSIRGRYQPFLDTGFREVPAVEPDCIKTEDNYFTLSFMSAGVEISGLYERRGIYMFGIRVDKRDNTPTDEPFEIMEGVDFTLPNFVSRKVSCGVDYRSLGDPAEASYTLSDIANAVNWLSRGFKHAGCQWGPSITTLIGATSEACKAIVMEQHIVVGLNIINKNVLHTPSLRLVRILKSWSKISKSIKTGRYNHVLEYADNRISERITRYSAGQILALINSKDGSKEEKQSRKQQKNKKGKRKSDDFEESEEQTFKKRKRQKTHQKGSQITSGSVEGHKYRGIAEARDSHVALNIDHDEQKNSLFKRVEDKEPEPEEILKAAESEHDTLFNVRMVPHGLYTSSDSSDSDSEDDKIDYSPSPPELFNVRMIPHGLYTSSESESEESESESEAEYEESPGLHFPTSSILVKHGTKRPADDKSSPAPEFAIGIDIGTSQSSVAVWNGSQVELLKNIRNQKFITSYVTFKDDVPTGGVSNQPGHEFDMFSGSSIFNMKRLIGRVDTDPIVHKSKNLPFLVQTLDIGVRPFIAASVNNMWKSTTPEEVLAIFLIELRAMAEVRLKRPVRDVVLTVPVSFSRFQLTRIERACAMAGLHIIRWMPEPTAVALLYAQQQQLAGHENMGSGSEKNALIFNLGAGYCDVALTAAVGGVSQIKALAGSAIGGEDILQNLMHYLLPDMDNLFSNHGTEEIKKMGLLRVASQEAIHRLSSRESVKIDVDLGDGFKISRDISREEFNELNKEVFEKCESLIKQCLHDAKVDVADLNDVITVGGCSFIPKIQSLVTTICKKELYTGMNPLEAVVHGAALEGAVASGINDSFGSLDLLTIQATPQSVGIRADGNTFIRIIPRNTAIPARRELFFTTIRDNQNEALIIVYEGDENMVENNYLLGYFKITGIPPAPKGVPEIAVSMDIDASNGLKVFAGVLMPGTPQPATPFIEVRMPTVDDGHGWCAEALHRTYGSNLDLVTVQKRV